jgi:hypothetical protein
MDRARLVARGLGHPLGGASRRRGEGDPLARLAHRLGQCAHDRGLAHTGAAGDHAEAAAQRGLQGLDLRGGELEAAAALPVLDGAARRDAETRALDPGELFDRLGEAELGQVEAQRIALLFLGLGHHGEAGKLLDDDPPLLREVLEGGLEALGGEPEELAPALEPGRTRQAAVPAALHRVLQRVEQAGALALDRIRLDADAVGDLVGALEADAHDLVGQAIGVVLELARGVAAVGLEDAIRQRRGEPVRGQEEQDVL